MRKIFLLLLFIFPLALFSQDAIIKGRIVDSDSQPISFVTVLVFEKAGSQALSGAVTDDSGNFVLIDLNEQDYYVEFSMVGFTTVSKTINASTSENIKITLNENIEQLDETVITAKAPIIKREPGKLIFNVENSSLSTGDTFNLLTKTPGVLVIGDNIQVKRTSPIIYLNDKRVYLTSSELASLLRSMDASNIKSIEVIDNPSAKYDAEATSVLNIITSKAVSIGYKGSVNATYEQAVFSKYRFSTAHFYKNDWLNAYASYSFSPRKDFKEDDNYIRFFNPDNISTKSIWESNFEKVTRSQAHQGNVILDFTLNEKNSLSFTSTVMVSPNKTFDNKVNGEIMDGQRQLDSVFKTVSYLENDASNLSFNLEHKIDLDEEGTKLTTAVNYIIYNNAQTQELNTDYKLPTGELINNVNFFTDANQDSKIFTVQTDFSKTIAEGDFETGIKYSYINTESGLDFFNIENSNPEYVESLSDLFDYTESIYAGYINYGKKLEKWNVNAGLRGEYTDVIGDSKSLGVINNQNYFDLFPSVSALYSKNDDNVFGVSYRRTVERPRYQSLNPFSYFITDNIVNNGNPNLIRTIKNKYMVSYTLKNKWAFEAYYIYKKDPLALLTFQDNENSTTQNLDANIIKDINYSFDITYYSPIYSWWYLSVYTSAYYIENEFFSIASPQETFTNDTFGFYAQMYSGFTLSKDGTFTTDLTATYISNMISGSLDMKNQFITSVSFRKSIWKNRASITVGVDDIFDTNNIPVTSRYYNQDNSYFAQAESRLFRVGFNYKFGNYKLRNNTRTKKTDEAGRLD
ncbi:MAG: TonB-dependent receptor [Flavobacteriaceae bacterium]|nr:TonB-dependent receptor [Flavobacteriaceae bacterium]